MSFRADQKKTDRKLKKGLNAEDSRRKREENSIGIRKSKKEEELNAKRRLAITSSVASSDSNGPMPTEIQQLFINQVNSEDGAQQLEGVTQFRKLLSIEKNPPIDDVIRTGIVPRFVHLLSTSPSAKLRFECAWAITNIASGNSQQTEYCLSLNVAPVFISLLSCDDEELREQAVWALGNIAGDSHKCRDYLLQQGILQPIINLLLRSDAKVTLLRNATWTLSNLCRGKPQPKFELVSPALPVLARLIHHHDSEVIIDSLWSLSYLSDGTDVNIDAVISAGVVPRIIDLLTHQTSTVQTPALRTLGNIVTGSDVQTQVAIDSGCLPVLKALLSHQKKPIRKEAAWTVSNITAGNYQQTQLVINANIIPSVVKLMACAEFDVKKEATWVISNASSWKSYEQVKYIMQQGVAEHLTANLGTKDTKLVQVTMEAIENILSVGNTQLKNGSNPFVSYFEEQECIDRLDQLQNHQNQQVYEKAVDLLEKYFGAEEENEVENFAPNTNATGNAFSFNTNQFQATTFSF